MSASESLFAFAATAATGFVLVTALFFGPNKVVAAEPQTTRPRSAQNPSPTAQPAHKPARTQHAAGPKQAPATKPATAPAQTPAQPEQRSGAACTCPSETSRPSLWPRPKYADLKRNFSESDEIATLENLQLALSETSDGGSYVWHSHNGWLNGIVQPTTSFKDSGGRICRHIQIMLTSGTQSSKAEGIACRLPSGQWQLEG